MIIECPACTTRYDIKAELPPEGRTVRCAKCGSVWRAMPETGEEAEPVEAAWTESSASAETTDHDTAGDHTGHDFAAAGEDHHDGELSADEGGAFASYEEAGAEPEPEASHPEEMPDAQPQPEPEPEPEPDGTHEKDWDTGKVSWFGSFRRRKKVKEKEEAEETAVTAAPVQPAAETIPFPRASQPFAPQLDAEEELRTLEEARQAVRSVFSTLGDGRQQSMNARGFSSPVTAPVAGEGGDEPVPSLAETTAESVWAAGGEREDGSEAAEISGWASGASRAEGWGGREFGAANWFGVNGQGEPEDRARSGEDGGGADAALREAMKAHFPSSPNRPSFTSSPPDDELAQKLESHLRSAAAAAAGEETPPRVAGLWSKKPPSAEEEIAEPAEEVVEETAETRDDDTVFDQRLYREIEETREKSGEVQRRGGGGLALAAAWGLFLCVAGGLLVGFFAFRDVAAGALPGLASLYRAIGIPVTVQPLNFEAVQYRWTASENKPVLIVSGNVYNRAQRDVRAPQFFITVKDQDPALDREYPASMRITGSKIRAEQHADFEIELLAPNPTITSVELELRDVR
jgi:predicted Zn finger-like uncharacterized protein